MSTVAFITFEQFRGGPFVLCFVQRDNATGESRRCGDKDSSQHSQRHCTERCKATAKHASVGTAEALIDQTDAIQRDFFSDRTALDHENGFPQTPNSLS